MKTVREIVREYLVKNGLDGLCTEDCGCSLDDVAACGNMDHDCQPAIKIIGKSRECADNIKDSGCDCGCSEKQYCFIPAEKGRKRK